MEFAFELRWNPQLTRSCGKTEYTYVFGEMKLAVLRELVFVGIKFGEFTLSSYHGAEQIVLYIIQNFNNCRFTVKNVKIITKFIYFVVFIYAQPFNVSPI